MWVLAQRLLKLFTISESFSAKNASTLHISKGSLDLRYIITSALSTANRESALSTAIKTIWWANKIKGVRFIHRDTVDVENTIILRICLSNFRDFQSYLTWVRAHMWVRRRTSIHTTMSILCSASMSRCNIASCIAHCNILNEISTSLDNNAAKTNQTDVILSFYIRHFSITIVSMWDCGLSG